MKLVGHFLSLIYWYINVSIEKAYNTNFLVEYHTRSHFCLHKKKGYPHHFHDTYGYSGTGFHLEVLSLDFDKCSVAASSLVASFLLLV